MTCLMGWTVDFLFLEVLWVWLSGLCAFSDLKFELFCENTIPSCLQTRFKTVIRPMNHDLCYSRIYVSIYFTKADKDTWPCVTKWRKMFTKVTDDKILRLFNPFPFIFIALLTTAIAFVSNSFHQEIIHVESFVLLFVLCNVCENTK